MDRMGGSDSWHAEQETAAVSPGPLVSETPEVMPHSLGKYVVVDEVGRGGVGKVYRALDPDLERMVAVKVLRQSSADSTDRARFVREAKALARSSHPNVVSVFEVGAEDQQTFIVMELVRGSDLRRWLNDEERPRAEILQRFLEAGRGLQAAHDAGLIHRDFKPSNVLVSEVGSKVTDFGLARSPSMHPSMHPSMAGDSSSQSISVGEQLTQNGFVLGTLAYMAPEQHAGEQLSPAADQYAFCISLFEALVGERPFSELRGAKLVDAKRRGAPSIPANASIPAHVARAIERGLAPEPDERYPSMNALLSELERNPAARRRTVLMSAGLVMFGGGSVALAMSVSTAPMEAEPCTDAATHLRGVWDDARRDATRSAIEGTGVPYASKVWERTARELDAYGTAWTEMHTEACRATSVRGEQSSEVLDLRMACLRRAKSALEATGNVLLETDTKLLTKAHRIVSGLPEIERCADIEALQAESDPPPAHEAEAVEKAEDLLAQAKAQRIAGRYDEAQATLDITRLTLEGVNYQPAQIELRITEGYVLDHLGDFGAAEAALIDALNLSMARGQLREMQRAASKLLHVVGYHQRRSEEALQRYQKLALDLRPEDGVAQTAGLNHLALVLSVAGRNEEAEQAYRKSIELQRDRPAPNPADVARLHSNLGIILWAQGKLAESEAEQRRALELSEDELGRNHPGVVASRANLAIALVAQGKFVEGEAVQREVLEISEVIYGIHPETANALTNLAAGLNYQGKNEEAAELHRRALAIRIETLGEKHTQVGEALNNLAIVLHDLGKSEEAIEMHLRALKIRREAVGAEHPDVAASLNNLGVVLAAVGRTEEAEAYYRDALDILLKRHGDGHPQVAQAQHNIADLALDDGRVQEALELGEKAWVQRQKEDNPPRERAETAFVVARALWQKSSAPEQRERALELARIAASEYDEAGELHADRLVKVRSWLSQRE